jgi:hypothetical protein
MKRLSLLATILAFCVSATAGEADRLIPRSMPGDKGRYYLLEKRSTGPTLQVVHKRVGVESVDFSRTEVNCKTKQYRELGYSSESVAAIKPVLGAKWTQLIQGSSKSDLAAFVCQ